MKKLTALLLALYCAASLSGCRGEESDPSPTSLHTSEGLIMVEGMLYAKPPAPSPGEVASEAVIGNTSSYTEGTPDEEGETNFDRELGSPYAWVREGIAVLYENEWYICTPVE